MKQEDVLLTAEEIKSIHEKVIAGAKGYFSQSILDKAIESENKAQCLKLLAVLNKEQLLVHSFLFPSGQHNPDCRTCELEKLLKEG